MCEHADVCSFCRQSLAVLDHGRNFGEADFDLCPFSRSHYVAKFTQEERK